MYKSLAAALLVAATEAFIYKTDTTVVGAIVGGITASSCQLTITAPASGAKTTTVLVAQTMTRTTSIAITANDANFVGCGWQEASAVWMQRIGGVKCTVVTSGSEQFAFEDRLTKLTTEPLATTVAAAALLTAPFTAVASADKAAAVHAASSTVTAAAGQTGTTTIGDGTYTVDATFKNLGSSATVTYTGTDEAAAKTVYDQILSGAAKTWQGVAETLNASGSGVTTNKT